MSFHELDFTNQISINSEEPQQKENLKSQRNEVSLLDDEQKVIEEINEIPNIQKSELIVEAEPNLINGEMDLNPPLKNREKKRFASMTNLNPSDQLDSAEKQESSFKLKNNRTFSDGEKQQEISQQVQIQEDLQQEQIAIPPAPIIILEEHPRFASEESSFIFKKPNLSYQEKSDLCDNSKFLLAVLALLLFFIIFDQTLFIMQLIAQITNNQPPFDLIQIATYLEQFVVVIMAALFYGIKQNSDYEPTYVWKYRRLITIFGALAIISQTVFVNLKLNENINLWTDTDFYLSYENTSFLLLYLSINIKVPYVLWAFISYTSMKY